MGLKYVLFSVLCNYATYLNQAYTRISDILFSVMELNAALFLPERGNGNKLIYRVERPHHHLYIHIPIYITVTSAKKVISDELQLLA